MIGGLKITKKRNDDFYNDSGKRRRDNDKQNDKQRNKPLDNNNDNKNEKSRLTNKERDFSLENLLDHELFDLCQKVKKKQVGNINPNSNNITNSENDIAEKEKELKDSDIKEEGEIDDTYKGKNTAFKIVNVSGKKQIIMTNKRKCQDIKIVKKEKEVDQNQSAKIENVEVESDRDRERDKVIEKVE